jgi:hypothetical protein
VFFDHHTGAQSDPAPTLQTEITQVEARVDLLEGRGNYATLGVWVLPQPGNGDSEVGGATLMIDMLFGSQPRVKVDHVAEVLAKETKPCAPESSASRSTLFS